MWWSGDLSLLFSLRTFITHSHTHTEHTPQREKGCSLTLSILLRSFLRNSHIFSLSLSLSLQSFAFCISCHFSVLCFCLLPFYVELLTFCIYFSKLFCILVIFFSFAEFSASLYFLRSFFLST